MPFVVDLHEELVDAARISSSFSRFWILARSRNFSRSAPTSVSAPPSWLPCARGSCSRGRSRSRRCAVLLITVGEPLLERTALVEEEDPDEDEGPNSSERGAGSGREVLFHQPIDEDEKPTIATAPRSHGSLSVRSAACP